MSILRNNVFPFAIGAESAINLTSVLSGRNEMIGRPFFFELIFSGGEVGEFILTFIPGKKGKDLLLLGIYILLSGCGRKEYDATA